MIFHRIKRDCSTVLLFIFALFLVSYFDERKVRHHRSADEDFDPSDLEKFFEKQKKHEAHENVHVRHLEPLVPKRNFQISSSQGNPFLLSAPGEAHFFDSDENYARGADFYLSMMPKANEFHHVFEKTPSYLTLKKVPGRIAQFKKDIKIIAILCDPVKRALSHFLHVHANKIKITKNAERKEVHFDPDVTLIDVLGDIFSKKSIDYLKSDKFNPPKHKAARAEFWKFLEKHEDRKPHNFVTRGAYAFHINIWKEYFRDDQMLFISGSDLAAKPAQVVMKIQDFLGAPKILNENHFVFNKTSGFYCLQSPGKHKPDCVGAHSGGKGRSKTASLSESTTYLLKRVFGLVKYDLDQALNTTVKF
ncbi:Oidioi.mRNA.OKI2018_I69.chr1.g761.t1.cds [Oikopleura dioica]|uniref:Sulfotransferase n=1 Tax=Oikopleura dioica TaxID=34765 RepID=A0ABN7SKV2_OIKDI|nr:Oidioi.mRNA.OKI2018_I69.chr1.g761.t1.cds [Oikopleura dioica]